MPKKQPAEYVILLVQPEVPAPPWWPTVVKDGVTQPAEVTLDPSYPGSWRIGECVEGAFVIESGADEIDQLIGEWMEDYEEDDYSWNFYTLDVEAQPDGDASPPESTST